MEQTDSFSKNAARKYRIELGGAMVAYAVVLFAAIPLMARAEGLSVRSAIILTPMIPIVFATIAIYRHVLRIDEFQRLQAFRVITVAAAATALLSMGYGFLEIAGFPKLSMMVVWPVMAAFWVLAGIVLRVRGRD